MCILCSMLRVSLAALMRVCLRKDASCVYLGAFPSMRVYLCLCLCIFAYICLHTRARYTHSLRSCVFVCVFRVYLFTKLASLVSVFVYTHLLRSCRYAKINSISPVRAWMCL